MMFLVPQDAHNKGVLFVMLTEADVQGMRDGRTQFIDQGHLQGLRPHTIIVSLNKDHDAIKKMLTDGGFDLGPGNEVKREPLPEEIVCPVCGMTSKMVPFEGKCIVCWAAEAKRLREAAVQFEIEAVGVLTAPWAWETVWRRTVGQVIRPAATDPAAPGTPSASPAPPAGTAGNDPG